MFSRWAGSSIDRRIVLATFILAAAAPLALGTADQLTAGGWLDPNSESAQVSDRLEAEFGGGRTAFVALFRSDAPDADATSPSFQAAIAATVTPLADDPRVSGVTGYAETGDDRFISVSGDALRRSAWTRPRQVGEVATRRGAPRASPATASR
jgi:RND superfamily putative drug exporter